MQFSFIKPLDQPPGTRRLLNELKIALADDRFSECRIIVAYAKSGPLYRLLEYLEKWRAKGNRLEMILGIDQQGTSKEALELSFAIFDSIYITREPGVTFHPKIYLFKGKTAARVFIGSNNLTVGGTEKNFEAAVQFDLDLPADSELLMKFEEAWTALLPASCPATKVIDSTLLAQLIADGEVIEERVMRSGSRDSENMHVSSRKVPRSGLIIKPESPLPKGLLISRPKGNSISSAVSSKTKEKNSSVASRTMSSAGKNLAKQPATAQGLAIQIKPHHNGEIFLSVSAALQYPAFFHWPFTGRTTPKKPDNPSYPQLDPDPIVNITVFGADPAPIKELSA